VRPVLAFLLLGLLRPATSQDRPPGAWLDEHTPQQWNRPGEDLPRPPKDVEVKSEPRPEFCKAQSRPAVSKEEQKLAAAGWLVFASFRGAYDLAVVGGSVTEDGMCRPDYYQYFVFVRGRFAGTLSPALMRARADASINKISFPAAVQIEAAFSRYTWADPLCCPSRISEVTFEIRWESGKPVVRLVQIQSGN
jgi:hypothetical protein